MLWICLLYKLTRKYFGFSPILPPSFSAKKKRVRWQAVRGQQRPRGGTMGALPGSPCPAVSPGPLWDYREGGMGCLAAFFQTGRPGQGPKAMPLLFLCAIVAWSLLRDWTVWSEGLRRLTWWRNRSRASAGPPHRACSRVTLSLRPPGLVRAQHGCSWSLRLHTKQLVLRRAVPSQAGVWTEPERALGRLSVE